MSCAVHLPLLHLLVLPWLAETNSRNSAAVVAYLPEWRYEGANWETISEHVSHLLLFSLEMDEAGHIVATDRLPRKDLMVLARAATRRHGTQLMLCFGGNGRSRGFSRMVRASARRKLFLDELIAMLDDLDLDGVDYNWEYPGYAFGRGYLSEDEIRKDYSGLSRLIKETKLLFLSATRPRTVTMAYYPDTRQEQLIKDYKLDKYVDMMHMMTYDQSGAQHSSMELATKSITQGKQVLPADKLTLGLPFYGRHSHTGEWTTFEDLVQRHAPLDPHVDSVEAPSSSGRHGQGPATIGFNGASTIELKARHALQAGIAGVMIWEVGQDCRLVPVTHGSTTHVRTCPSDNSSLLLSITRAIVSEGFDKRQSRNEL